MDFLRARPDFLHVRVAFFQLQATSVVRATYP
jgi:hypothetical protein